MKEQIIPLSIFPFQIEIKNCVFLRHCVTVRAKCLSLHDFGRDADLFSLRHACVTEWQACVTRTISDRPRVMVAPGEILGVVPRPALGGGVTMVEDRHPPSSPLECLVL